MITHLLVVFISAATSSQSLSKTKRLWCWTSLWSHRALRIKTALTNLSVSIFFSNAIRAAKTNYIESYALLAATNRSDALLFAPLCKFRPANMGLVSLLCSSHCSPLCSPLHYVFGLVSIQETTCLNLSHSCAKSRGKVGGTNILSP